MAAPSDRAWAAHPKAEAFVRAALEAALKRAPQAEKFRASLLETCAIRLRDMLDHIAVTAEFSGYAEAGWREVGAGVWRHFDGAFPDIIERNALTIGFKVECVESFARCTAIDAPTEGQPYGPYRRMRVFSGDGAFFDAVERHGWSGYEAPSISTRTIDAARLHQQILRTRHRPFRRAASGLTLTKRLAIAAIAELGKNWACALFMRAERDYWAARCGPASLQQRRQRALGVGWSNIDHYAYECSREHFAYTIDLFERLGFERREFIHAGAGAGWGAQVMEQPVLRCALLVKVDASANDMRDEIAGRALSPLTVHGPVGLWTALHGESLLEGGVSQAAALYDLRAIEGLMRQDDAALTRPASDQANLRRIAARAERRAVDPKRVEALERSGHIGRAQADDWRFLGAHAGGLEMLERVDGYKGFGAAAVRREAATEGVREAPAPRSAA